MAREISGLSKTQFMMGKRCALSLWFRNHGMRKNPPSSKDVPAKFAIGDEVGKLAQGWFGTDAVEVDPRISSVRQAETETKKTINAGHDIIFEATAIHPADNSNARIDALVRVPGTNQWDMFEVKSSTRVKDTHIQDLAFQYHVFTGAGYNIRKACALTVNDKYVRNGSLDMQKMFKVDEITAAVQALQPAITAQIAALDKMISGTEPPADLGNHCTNPSPCEYKPHCWKTVPLYSVFNVFAGVHDPDVKIKRTGSYDINDIPLDLLPSGARAVELAAHKTGMVQSDPTQLKKFLADIKYPVHYLDYESVQSPAPLYDGTRPYQSIPFQFSLHIQDKPGTPLRHETFLHKKATDPRKNFAKALIDALGTEGSIVVYNANFEAQRNNELGHDFPQFQQQLRDVNGRMVDLYIPFRNRWLYSPAQNGSGSIKAVLPAFTNLNYEDLEIANGQQALDEYLSFARGKKNSAEKKRLWKALEEYCGQDTLAMVELHKVLLHYANSSSPSPVPLP